MTRRTRTQLAAGLLIVIAGAAVFAIDFFTRPKEPAELAHITLGMTHEEVARVFARSCDTGWDVSSDPGVARMRRSWFDEHGAANIVFQNGKVSAKSYCVRCADSWLDRIGQRLGWRSKVLE